MTGISVDLGPQKAFGAALKNAPKELRRELFRAVQRAVKPVKGEIQQSARATLPSSGGLGDWVAGIALQTRQNYSGQFPGVTIVGALDNKREVRKVAGKRRKSRKSGTFGARADLKAINRGRVMHPTFGRGPLVGPQMVKPGFWDKPLEGEVTARAKREVEAALQATADKLAQQAN